jgi:hypothetical protein
MTDALKKGVMTDAATLLTTDGGRVSTLVSRQSSVVTLLMT